jgi:hypothetical protein
MPEGMTAVCIAKDTRKQLKHISAEHEAPMCGILSALVAYAVSAPEFVTQLLHPECRELKRDN